MTTHTQATGVAIATSAEDAAAVAAVERHHAELSGRLTVLVDGLLNAAVSAGGVDVARGRLANFLADELLPHAEAEETSLYPAAATAERARLLVDGMVAEHRVLERLAGEVSETAEPVRVAAAARALQVLVEAHLAKENELLLPEVAANPAVSLAAVLSGMHEILGHTEDEAGDGCGGGSCGCGGDAEASTEPVLDVRSVPHAIRHATVFGALDAVPAGGTLVLVAPHDPLPLLDQIRSRTGGAFAVAYEERGPEAWRLRMSRQR